MKNSNNTISRLIQLSPFFLASIFHFYDLVSVRLKLILLFGKPLNSLPKAFYQSEMDLPGGTKLVVIQDTFIHSDVLKKEVLC